MPKEELLEELGIPLTPVRLKCAILGLATLKLALHKGKGTPLPEEWARRRARAEIAVPAIAVCPVEELPPGEMKLVRAGTSTSASTTSTASCSRLEDRCSHDDGPLCEGDWDPEKASSSARAMARTSTSAPACRCRCRPSSPSRPIAVRVEDGMITVEVPVGRARRSCPRCARPSRGRGSPRARGGAAARAQRSRQVTPATGRFLFAIVAPQASASVLEIGGSRGYSTIWLAAAARILGGTRRVARVRSREVRGLAARTSRRRGSASGPSSSRATRSRRCRRWRMSSTSSSSTRRRTTTRRCSRSPGRSSSPARS